MSQTHLVNDVDQQLLLPTIRRVWLPENNLAHSGLRRLIPMLLAALPAVALAVRDSTTVRPRPYHSLLSSSACISALIPSPADSILLIPFPPASALLEPSWRLLPFLPQFAPSTVPPHGVLSFCGGALSPSCCSSRAPSVSAAALP